MSTEKKVVPMHDNPKMNAALAYASIGWHIFPCWWIKDDGQCACGSAQCKSPGKHPISRVAPWGQNNATTDAESIRKWWTQYPDANIAVFLERSNLCAIDIDPRNGGLDTIDQIEAKHGKLESDLLQFTGGGGEHRYFTKPTMGSLPGKLGPGVDVKVNGYTMLEPSNHVSGKLYGWEASSDPREGIMASPLPDWLRDLAMQHVTAPPMQGPAEGRVLLITEAQKKEIAQALKAIPADDRETWLQVGMALQSTDDPQWAYDTWCQWSEQSPKFDPVDQLRVWRSIKAKGLDGITYRSIFEMAKRNGLTVRPIKPELAEEVILSISEPAHRQMVEQQQRMVMPDEVPFPDELLKAPGVIGEFMQWMLSCAQKPQPVLALAASMSLVATALSQKVKSQTGLRTNLYLVSVAETSAGKEHGRKCIKVAMEEAGLSSLVGGEELASGQGLLGRVAQHPVTVFQPDEFGLLLKSINTRGAGAHLQSIVTNLMKLFTSAGTVYHGTEYADQKNRPRLDIPYPCVNVHATTTPEPLFDAFSGADIASGNLNRLLILFAPSGKWPLRFTEISAPAVQLVDWLKAARMLMQSATGCGMTPENPIKVPMTQEAENLFAELYEWQQDTEQSLKEKNGLQHLWGRVWEHASKVALVVACAKHTDPQELLTLAEQGQLVVTGKDAEWAISFVKFLLNRMEYEVASRVADNEFAGIKQKVLSTLLKAGPKGLTHREIEKNCRAFRIEPFRQDAIIESLVRSEHVRAVNFNDLKSDKKAGRPRVAWVASEYLQHMLDNEQGGQE
jgi:hypothetical protein